MKDLFERLKSEGCGLVHELVASKAQEGVQLDFKLKANPANGELNREDRGVLGAALSAFANSGGGLLIWGIEAKPNSERVDAAQKAIPIPNLARFKSDVSRAVGKLLMPRHDGIRVEAIEDPKTQDGGYLAVWVDRSERRPHRSEAAGDKHYYKRAGDSSFVMEHYDIEDAFNRLGPTELLLRPGKLLVRGNSTENMYRRYTWFLDFFLQNDSRLSASAPYVWIDELVGASLVGLDSPYLAARRVGLRDIFSGDATTMVHPGLDVPAFRLKIMAGHHLGEQRWDVGGVALGDATISFTCGIGCQNSRTKTINFEWRGANLQDLLSL